MLRITTAILLLSPAIASAQCLTAESLDAGISIQYANGNTGFIERLPDGTLSQAYNDSESYSPETITFSAFDGVFELAHVTHEAGNWEALRPASSRYDFALDSARPYTPGATGSGSQTLSRPERSDNTWAFSWAVYPRAPLEIGDCSYEAVQVFTSGFDKNRGELYTRDVAYLPELGFGLLLGDSWFSLFGSYDITALTAN